MGGQIGLATLLIAVSLLLARGVLRVSDADPGFRVEGVLTLRASVDLMGCSPRGMGAFWIAAVEEARALQGVSDAGVILFAPLGDRSDRVTLDVPGSDWAAPPVQYNEVTEGAMEVLGLDVIRGRAFSGADAVAESTFFSRVAGVVAAEAGGSGLLLALTGLFGTVAYDATRQMKEMAIRRAVGASDAAVRRAVAWRGLRTSAAGALAGLVAAVLVGSIVRGLLHGLPAYDPLSLLAVAAVMVVTGVGATWTPAGKALRVGPAQLLREE